MIHCAHFFLFLLFFNNRNFFSNKFCCVGNSTVKLLVLKTLFKRIPTYSNRKTKKIRIFSTFLKFGSIKKYENLCKVELAFIILFLRICII